MHVMVVEMDIRTIFDTFPKKVLEIPPGLALWVLQHCVCRMGCVPLGGGGGKMREDGKRDGEGGREERRREGRQGKGRKVEGREEEEGRGERERERGENRKKRETKQKREEGRDKVRCKGEDV